VTQVTRRNRIGIVVLLVALAGLAAWALAPRPVTVQLGEVTRGVYEQAISDDGRTRVRHRYLLSAPLSGRVERIALRVGDTVAKGQVVAVLAPSLPAFVDARSTRELSERIGSAEAEQMRARAEASRVAAQRDQARADLARQERLARAGFLSAAAREQGELALRTADRSVEAANFAAEAAAHALAQARAALARYRAGEATGRWEVRAPAAGVVLRVVQENEGAVPLGAPLIEIADPRALEAVVDVLSQDSVSIRAGMTARIEPGSGLPPVAARVRRVEPAAFTKVSALGIEEQRVNVLLDFAEDLERLQPLGDGYRIEAHIVIDRVEDAVRVPVGALFREGDAWSVFVVADGRAHKRTVAIARRNGLLAQVTEGLQPGDRVVLYPSDALADRSKVQEAQGGRR